MLIQVLIKWMSFNFYQQFIVQSTYNAGRQIQFLFAKLVAQNTRLTARTRYIQLLLGFNSTKNTEIYTRVAKSSFDSIKYPLDL